MRLNKTQLYFPLLQLGFQALSNVLVKISLAWQIPFLKCWALAGAHEMLLHHSTARAFSHSVSISLMNGMFQETCTSLVAMEPAYLLLCGIILADFCCQKQESHM